MQIIRVRLVNSREERKGCEKAPVAVLNELKKIECNEKGKVLEFGRLQLEEIHVDLKNVKEANDLIYENSKEIFEKNDKAFFIGGDHSISYSIAKAFMKIEEKPFLIVFDAHADCIKPRKEPLNEEWLRAVIENGFVNVLLISARKILEEEFKFLKQNDIAVIKMDVLQENLEEVCDMIMEQARKASGFYISIDIDSADPGFAPGTNLPEPGGLSSRDLIYMVKRLSILENFRGADIVEINPDKDINEMTVKLGAKLLSEMV
jgi:agmatinase